MYKIIACNIFKREIEFILDDKKIKDVIFVEQGLHNSPSKMKMYLQDLIDEVENDEINIVKYTGIILMYGLCGNGTLGLKTSKLKLIIPKIHDCMALFLGSKNKYKDIIDNNKGIYWYNHAWMDHTPMPNDKYLDSIKSKYYEYYDEDNAEFLFQIELDGLKRYNKGLYINSPIVSNEKYKFFVKDACETFGWKYEEEDGNLSFIENIINGKFEHKNMLVLPPNEEIRLSIDSEVLK